MCGQSYCGPPFKVKIGDPSKGADVNIIPHLLHPDAAGKRLAGQDGAPVGSPAGVAGVRRECYGGGGVSPAVGMGRSVSQV